MPDLEERKILITWKSPSRPFKKRNRDFFTNISAIVFLFCVILMFVAGSWPLILVILSLTFVIFVLNTVPPEEMEHQITNKGVVTAGKEYLWTDLNGFFITDKYEYKILNINQKSRPYLRLMILVNQSQIDQVKEILKKYLEFKEKPELNFLDKSADWLSKKVPLEK